MMKRVVLLFCFLLLAGSCGFDPDIQVDILSSTIDWYYDHIIIEYRITNYKPDVLSGLWIVFKVDFWDKVSEKYVSKDVEGTVIEEIPYGRSIVSSAILVGLRGLGVTSDRIDAGKTVTSIKYYME